MPKNGENVGCQSWKASSGAKYIHSGDQPKSSSTTNSALIYVVDIVRDEGKIQFSYKVDADVYSGLEFYIDDQQVLDRTGYVHEYTIKSFPLTKGYHILEWRYVRNFQTSDSKHRAYINWMKVYGQKLTVETCTKCPLGTFNDKTGQSSCKPCPTDTFSDEIGLTQCKACPDGKYATLGASSCQIRPACIAKDYSERYTPCKNGKRQLVYEWVSPKYCQGGISLPPNKENQECNQCSKGLYRKDDVCTRCAGKGEYYDTTYKSCKTCYEGYSAVKYMRYDSNFLNEVGSLPSSWFTRCTGECDKENQGWRVISNVETSEAYLDGAGKGYGDETVLSIPVDLYTDGQITTLPDTSALLVFVNKTLEADVSKSSVGGGKGTIVSRFYTAGHYSLTLIFDRYDTPNKQATVKVKSIVIEGERNGAADNCAECKEGYYCPQASDDYKPCPPGTYSNLRQEACMACYRNTFQNKWGQNKCISCGAGTYSDAKSAECANTCTFSAPGTEISYNFTDLQGVWNKELKVFGPLSIPNTTFNFYFSLCSKFDTASTPFCRKESRNIVVSEQRKERTNLNRRKGYSTYTCIEDDSDERRKIHPSGDMGANIAFLQDASRGNGLSILFSTEYKCPQNNGVYRTQVDMKCNPKEGLGKPVVVSDASIHPQSRLEDVCLTRVLWESHVACPVCTIYDYESILGECENGKRTKKWFLKKDATCYPYSPMSQSLPQSEEIECPVCTTEHYSFVETKCVKGLSTRKAVWKEPKVCTDGVELPEDVPISCEDLEVGKITAVVGVSAIGVVFIGLVGVIWYFYAKNKQLYEQYDVLGREPSQEEDMELQNSSIEVYDNEDSDDDVDMGFTTTASINRSRTDSDDDKI